MPVPTAKPTAKEVAIDNDKRTQDVQVFDLQGRRLGTGRTPAEAVRFPKTSPVIIVDGKKMLRP